VSTSLLYHGFSIRGYKYVRTDHLSLRRPSLSSENA
jgi:hypothetical protein